ncbi:MAG: glycosyltransferase family 2 protein [Anaerolineales bacterium]|nr:glycosyltransferase family 2 protein [Anaerolineales bacterium]
MSLSLSVILCTKDRPDDLEQCIVSIIRGKRLPNEIMIIDDGNLDPSLIQKTLQNSNIQFHYRQKSPPNVNISRNLAVSIANGDILSFLDDDVILDPNYYLVVMQAFEEDKEQRIAGITGAIKMNTHPLKRVFLRLFGLESNQPGRVQSCGAVTLVRAGEIHQPIKVDWLSGCNMNFRRWVFDLYHFDEQDSGYIWGDDRDFTYPIGQKYLLVALPNAILVHKKSPVSRSSAKNLGRMEIFHLGRFFVKNLPQRPKNWSALGWAFWGIILKNTLSILNPSKSVTSIQQLFGNFIGLFQFFSFIRERNEKCSKY